MQEAFPILCDYVPLILKKGRVILANRDYKTGQPCYNTTGAYFTSRDEMQLKLKRN